VSNPEEPGSTEPSQSPYASPSQGSPTPGQQPPPPPYGAPAPQWGPPQPGQPPAYGQPQYGQPQYGGYPAQQGTNGFAIASLICAFLCWPLGLIFGFVAKSQIKARGGGGDGLATAGIIISLVWLALVILLAATGNVHFHASSG
jgi:hypothetical protein